MSTCPTVPCDAGLACAGVPTPSLCETPYLCRDGRCRPRGGAICPPTVACEVGECITDGVDVECLFSARPGCDPGDTDAWCVRDLELPFLPGAASGRLPISLLEYDIADVTSTGDNGPVSPPLVADGLRVLPGSRGQLTFAQPVRLLDVTFRNVPTGAFPLAQLLDVVFADSTHERRAIPPGPQSTISIFRDNASLLAYELQASGNATLYSVRYAVQGDLLCQGGEIVPSSTFPQPGCMVDADCDDGNLFTLDRCMMPEFVCTHLPLPECISSGLCDPAVVIPPDTPLCCYDLDLVGAMSDSLPAEAYLEGSRVAVAGVGGVRGIPGLGLVAGPSAPASALWVYFSEPALILGATLEQATRATMPNAEAARLLMPPGTGPEALQILASSERVVPIIQIMDIPPAGATRMDLNLTFSLQDANVFTTILSQLSGLGGIEYALPPIKPLGNCGDGRLCLAGELFPTGPTTGVATTATTFTTDNKGVAGPDGSGPLWWPLVVLLSLFTAWFLNRLFIWFGLYRDWWRRSEG